MLKSVVNTRPNELEPGDELVVAVKVIIDYKGDFKVYRCDWAEHTGAPEGWNWGDDPKLEAGVIMLMPVLAGRKIST